MGKLKVQSDKYLNNKKQYDSFFMDVVPVDLNGGLVHPKADKWGMDKDCLTAIEDGLQEQFGLEDVNED